MHHFVDVTIEDDHWATECAKWEDFFVPVLSRVTESLSLPSSYSLSILLTHNDAVQRLNHRFRGKSKPTNVLSFPQSEPTTLPDGSIFLGDLAFALQVIRHEATQDKKDFLNHMTHLTIHGILHLLGYDHETEHDAHIMEDLEVSLLNHFNIRNPYIQTYENND